MDTEDRLGLSEGKGEGGGKGESDVKYMVKEKLTLSGKLTV